MSSPNATPPPNRYYQFFRILWRGVFAVTMRMRSSGLESLPQTGGTLFAVSHLGHLDPIVVSATVSRSIRWISRLEFYRHWFMRWVLQRGGAISINRAGYARPALRQALEVLAAGEVVGIFPEGEVTQGPSSVLRGGLIKHGVAWLAARSGCPVIPIIVLGTHRLQCVRVWLPAKRGRLWVKMGAPLQVPAGASTRASRQAFAADLERDFQRLYAELRSDENLPEDLLP